jgi:murein tripeptide amidase MpaA
MWQDQHSMDLLMQNKYYVIPQVNVDGANYIEETYKKTGKFPEKRTNMDVHIDNKERGGVDLNRNFGF